MNHTVKFYPPAERAERLANYLVEHCATVRSTAQHFGISKSTVHKDLTNHLKQVNRTLYAQAQKVLQKNKAERHLRGGEATKRKFREEYVDGEPDTPTDL